MRRLPAAASLALMLLLLAGCGRNAPLGRLAVSPDSGKPPSLSYRVVLEGEDLRPALASRLRQVLETARPDLPPAPNRVVLLRQGRGDLDRLRAVLRAEGYYDARASVRLEEETGPPPATGAPTEETAVVSAGPRYRLVFEIRPGPRYRFGGRRVTVAGPPHGFDAPSPSRLGLKDGEPAVAGRILAAEAQLLRIAREQGHALATLGERRVVVDHSSRLVEVELVVEPGPKYRFGEVRFVGAGDVDETFLVRRVRLAPGELFDPRRVAKARSLLVSSGLFTAVRAKTGERPDATGGIPVTFELVPRKPRSIGGAVGVHSDRGPGGRLFFQHRNLFGGGENLRIEGKANRDLASARLQLRVPEFVRPAQELVGGLRYSEERSDAFTSLSLGVGAAIEREIDDRLRVSFGIRYRFADIRDKTVDGAGRNDKFRLLSLPSDFVLDRRDSMFDPTEGTRTVFAFEPFQDTADVDTRFLRTKYTQTAYFKLQRRPRLVLALRGVVGTIVGVDRIDLPADERFYAGGGGSIRGIPFQMAGPLNSDDDPLGGRSLVEGSVELRLRPFERLGFVAFLDGGSAFTAVIPDFEEETPRFGAGLGIRYATPVGPLRVDVAVPFKRNKDVDDPFQLYISLGQAF